MSAHRWERDGRCKWCAMDEDWPCAEAACSNAPRVPGVHLARQKQAAGLDARGRAKLTDALGLTRSQRADLRRVVEAGGVRWDAYVERRRRMATHEEAMAGVDRRRKASA
jgi:hypothetical protein